MIRNPLATLESLRDSILDIIRFLKLLPRFDVVSVSVLAIASTDIDAYITSSKFNTLYGGVQLGGTTTDIPVIAYNDNKSIKATYSFGASTSGKQSYRFLLVGV